MTILILNISFCDLESSGPSAASIAFAVILVIGGVAMVAMILICYRRWSTESNPEKNLSSQKCLNPHTHTERTIPRARPFHI